MSETFRLCCCWEAWRQVASCTCHLTIKAQIGSEFQVIKQFMALGCLTCRSLEGTDSVNGRSRLGQPDGGSFKSLWGKSLDRKSSGSMSTKSETLRTQKTIEKAKKTPHRFRTTVSPLKVNRQASEGEPRLVRSPGLRRDWSFENLKAVTELGEK